MLTKSDKLDYPTLYDGTIRRLSLSTTISGNLRLSLHYSPEVGTEERRYIARRVKEATSGLRPPYNTSFWQNQRSLKVEIRTDTAHPDRSLADLIQLLSYPDDSDKGSSTTSDIPSGDQSSHQSLKGSARLIYSTTPSPIKLVAQEDSTRFLKYFKAHKQFNQIIKDSQSNLYESFGDRIKPLVCEKYQLKNSNPVLRHFILQQDSASLSQIKLIVSYTNHADVVEKASDVVKCAKRIEKTSRTLKPSFSQPGTNTGEITFNIESGDDIRNIVHRFHRESLLSATEAQECLAAFRLLGQEKGGQNRGR